MTNTKGKAESKRCAVTKWNATQPVTYLYNINYSVPRFWIMEQPYLTKLNNLAAAWPSVYNRIDKHRAQVIKFHREPQGGKLSSPALSYVYVACLLSRGKVRKRLNRRSVVWLFSPWADWVGCTGPSQPPNKTHNKVREVFVFNLYLNRKSPETSEETWLRQHTGLSFK